MNPNITNKTPFLRTSRDYPEETHQLSVEVNKSYVDIANAVNNRTIGIYTTIQTITGDSYFIDNVKRQTLRKIFKTSNPISTFDHGINFDDVYFFVKLYGVGFDGTNYYPIPYVNPISGDVGFYVTPKQVIIVPGFPAGIALFTFEWMTNS